MILMFNALNNSVIIKNENNLFPWESFDLCAYVYLEV